MTENEDQYPQESWQVIIGEYEFTISPFLIGQETRFRIKTAGSNFVMRMDRVVFEFIIVDPNKVEELIYDLEESLSAAIMRHEY